MSGGPILDGAGRAAHITGGTYLAGYTVPRGRCDGTILAGGAST